mmetsp:Transcript_32920/g.53430  ORF Transcript_32920/g.53430 Transcript_32920/m.53430 type:complete len:166 (-) Transcript_32920:140-637(-)
MWLVHRWKKNRLGVVKAADLNTVNEMTAFEILGDSGAVYWRASAAGIAASMKKQYKLLFETEDAMVVEAVVAKDISESTDETAAMYDDDGSDEEDEDTDESVVKSMGVDVVEESVEALNMQTLCVLRMMALYSLLPLVFQLQTTHCSGLTHPGQRTLFASAPCLR